MRAIGLDGVAFFGIAVAIGSLVSVVSEYSFDLSGIKDAAREGHLNKDGLNKLIVNRIYTQWSIFSFILFVFIFFSFAFKIVWGTHHWDVFGAATLVALTNIAFPFWVSQSLGLVGLYSIYFSSARLLSLPLVIFLLPAYPTGIAYIALLYFPLFVSMLALLLHCSRHKLHFVAYDKKSLVSILRESFDVFLSRLFQNFYQNGGILALGLLAPAEATGLYTLFDRVRKASLFCLTPISRTLYHLACELENKYEYKMKKNFRILVSMYCFVAMILSVFIFYSSDIISRTFAGDEAQGLLFLVQLASLFPLISIGTIVYGQNFVLARGLVSQYTIAISIAFGYYALVILPFSFFGKALGALFALLSTEVVLATSFIFLARSGQLRV